VTPFIAMQPQSALLDPVPQSVAEMLLAVIRPPVESERRLLVEVLELLGAEPSTLSEAASDPQLSLLPFAENLTGPLRAKRPLPTLAGRKGDPFPRFSSGRSRPCALLSYLHRTISRSAVTQAKSPAIPNNSVEQIVLAIFLASVDRR